MGNALLAGVNPVYGLYTVLAATPIGALFTSSVYMNIDSTGALAATAGGLLALYPEEQGPAALATLTLTAGAFMLIAGVLKLGFLTRFISNAVLRGFLTGIGLNIILSQLSDFTGYSSDFDNKVVQAVDTLLHPGQLNPQMLLVGVVTVVLIVTLDRVRYVSKVSLIIALATASALVPLFGLTTVPLVSGLGPMPETLPRPVLPDLTLIPELLMPAFSLAIIALAQSAGISQAYANPDGKYPDVSRDFAGQGAGNLASAFVQGLPAGGSLGGTAILVKGGARSRWANILTGVSAAILILAFGELIGRIAMPALAGLLMVVGYQTINFREINVISRTSSRARWLMIATFIATLILPLQGAIFFGVAASFAVFTFRESESTSIVELVTTAEGVPTDQPAPALLPSHAITLLGVYGNLFFAGARNLEEDLPRADDTHGAVVILSLKGHTEIGSTFIGVLNRYEESLKLNGNTLLLANVTDTVRDQLVATGEMNELREENVFASHSGQSLQMAYERAKQLVDAGSSEL